MRARFRTSFPNVRGTHVLLFTRAELDAFLAQHRVGRWGGATKQEQFANEIALAQLESGQVPRDGVTLVSRFRIRRRRWVFFSRAYPVTVLSYFRRTRPQTVVAAATDIIVGTLQ